MQVYTYMLINQTLLYSPVYHHFFLPSLDSTYLYGTCLWSLMT